MEIQLISTIEMAQNDFINDDTFNSTSIEYVRNKMADSSWCLPMTESDPQNTPQFIIPKGILRKLIAVTF